MPKQCYCFLRSLSPVGRRESFYLRLKKRGTTLTTRIMNSNVKSMISYAVMLSPLSFYDLRGIRAVLNGSFSCFYYTTKVFYFQRFHCPRIRCITPSKALILCGFASLFYVQHCPIFFRGFVIFSSGCGPLFHHPIMTL